MENSKIEEAANASALRHLAGLAGVAEMELMAKLLSKYGLETALEMKRENESQMLNQERESASAAPASESLDPVKSAAKKGADIAAKEIRK